MGSVLSCFTNDFYGGSKSDLIRGSGEHAERRWFALVGIYVDRLFLRPHGPIETIETIEMIEMISESAGLRYVAQVSDGGVESMSSWTFGVSAPAFGRGIPYGLEVSKKSQS